MANVNYEIFKKQTSGSMPQKPLQGQFKPSPFGCGGSKASVFNIYGERNKILCQSEPQLNAWMNRGGVSVMRASDLSSLLAGSGNCASACGGSSCGNDDFDWKDMALMQMMPGLAQVAVAGIAKLFGIDMGGSAQAVQAGGAQQGSGIFPTNAQNGGAQQGGGVNGGGYNGGGAPASANTSAPASPASPAPASPASPAQAPTPESTTSTTTTGTADKADKVIETYKKDSNIEPVIRERVNLAGQIASKKTEIEYKDKAMEELDKALKEEDKAKLKGLNDAVTAQKKVVTEKEGAVNAQNGEITKLKGELPGLQNDVENAKKALGTLKKPADDAPAAEKAQYTQRKAELDADLKRAEKALSDKERKIRDEERALQECKDHLQDAKDDLQKAEQELVNKKNELDKANKEKRDKLQAEKTKLQDELEKLEAKDKELEAIIAQHEAQEKGKKNTETDSFEDGRWTGSELADGTKITRRGKDNVVLRNGDPVSTTIFANGPEYDRGSEYEPSKDDKDRLRAKYGEIDGINWDDVTNVRPKKDDSCVVTIGNTRYYIHKQGGKYIQKKL